METNENRNELGENWTSLTNHLSFFFCLFLFLFALLWAALFDRQSGTLELNGTALKRLQHLKIGGGIDLRTMSLEAIKRRRGATTTTTTVNDVTDDVAELAATASKLSLADVVGGAPDAADDQDSASDSDSGYDLADGEEDASLSTSTSVGGEPILHVLLLFFCLFVCLFVFFSVCGPLAFAFIVLQTTNGAKPRKTR